MAALRAHLSQVGVENDFFRLSELVGPEAMGVEYFRLARGQLGPLGTRRPGDRPVRRDLRRPGDGRRSLCRAGRS